MTGGQILGNVENSQRGVGQCWVVVVGAELVGCAFGKTSTKSCSSRIAANTAAAADVVVRHWQNQVGDDAGDEGVKV